MYISDIRLKFLSYVIKEDGKESLSEQAKLTVDVNYFATLRVCETLFPILRKDARVVNVSSSAGHLSRIPAAELRAKFSDPSLTVPKLNELMQQFVKERENDQHGEAGWPDSAYIVSKVGLSALTILQQKQFDNEAPNRNVQVNSVHPGYVDTDMTSHKGHLTIEEGAKAPLYLALEPHNLKGKYVWFNSQVLDWYADSTPSRA